MFKLIFIEAGMSPKKIEETLLPYLNKEGYKIDRVDPIGKQYIYVLYKKS